MSQRQGSTVSFRWWLGCLIAASTLGCGDKANGTGNTMPQGCPDSGARVFFTVQGDVVLNGERMDAPKLKDALLALSPTPTVICYSRENPSDEPHPAVDLVMEAMMATQLPIGLFTDSTFQTPVVPE